MGCDIHLRVQVQAADNSWRDVPEQQLGPDWQYNAEYSNSPPRSRNYTLFGRLAGVRRDDWEPLFEGRGVPDDLKGTRWSERQDMPELEPTSPDYDPDYAQQLREQEEAHPDWDDWEHHPDYHSHTWATLAELRDADWGVTITSTVRTDPVTYRRWRDEGVLPDHHDMMHDLQHPDDAWGEAVFAEGEKATEPETRAEFSRWMMSGKASVIYTVSVKPLLQSGFVLWLSSPAAEALVQAAGGAERVRMLIAFDN